MLYYLLTIITLTGAPVWTDDRVYTFEACRTRRLQEIHYYIVYENLDVYALCTPIH